MAGREALSGGLIRRIGNGETTNIWSDRWLSDHFSGRPITPKDDQEVATVAELLTASGQWNEELIRTIFFPVDAEAILRTPTRLQQCDMWAWEPERHGHYSAKSAYRIVENAKARPDTDEAAGSGDESWKKLWKLSVPPKVRVFWWRVIHEFLPAKHILHRRHVEPIANCEVCGADQESIRHVLLDCTTAKAFWNRTKETTGIKIPVLHPDTWARDLLFDTCGKEQERCVLITSMYALWTLRNNRRHEEAWPVNVAVQWAYDTAFDLWQLCHKPKLGTTKRSDRG